MSKDSPLSRIKKVLSLSEWKTTTHIAKAGKVHFYKAQQVLTDLLEQGEVELDEKPNSKYWRLKEELK